ncbi:MAG: NeuD/PglB/VioB family sugar acetyltransferase [Bacteroidaceae bacterium]|nr:NeuD/PglB/VioB family sugar acetyltransferase [Bacteroidaceae bacterium]
MDIRIEKFNVSDDKFLLAQLCVENGDKVSTGDLIYTIESSKAAIDVVAPCDGFIFFNSNAEEMNEYPVGFCVAKITDRNENPFMEQEKTISINKSCNEMISRDVCEKIITPEAQILMKKYNVDEMDIDCNFISKKDILQLLHKDVNLYKSNDIVIVAGGGFGKMCIDAINESHCFNIVGIIDDGLDKGSIVYGYKVLGGIDEMLPVLYEKGLRLAVNSIGAIAATQKDIRFTLRQQMAEKIKSYGYIIPNVIHPKSTIESSVRLGEGNVVMAGAYLGSDVVIGDNCLINNHAIISHDCVIGNCVRISPNATLAGNVTIGNNCLIGMNTSIYLGVIIGENCIIRNGENVFKTIPQNSIV